MTFGMELRKIRENKNRTQAFMALQLDMAQSTYWRIENDKVPASSDYVYDLLDNDYFTKEEQLILAEKYQEKVDEEWVEPKPKSKPKPKPKPKKKKKPKKDKLVITDEQRAEYRRRKSERYFKEYKPKKSTNKEIKRARSTSAIQKVFY